MSRREKSTPQNDLRRATILLAGIYIVTVVGMTVVPLLTMGRINVYLWIAVGLMTVLCLGAWWFYKRQIDAEIREDAAQRAAKKNRAQR